MHPARMVKNAVTPRPVTQIARAAYATKLYPFGDC
jgi:hypothetical protein